MDHSFAAARQFAGAGRVQDLRPYGNGNVNHTYLVTVDDAAEKRFILQRLNTRVFPRPHLVMGNLRIVTEHVCGRLDRDPLPPGRVWRTPRVLLTAAGRDHWLDPEGSFWRALSFIDNARTADTIGSPEQAREAGYALGLFHHLLSDLPPERLADTLPGFHLAPGYLRHYDSVLEGKGINPAAGPAPFSAGQSASPEVRHCLRFIARRRGSAARLEEARASGRLAPRVMHGDPKVNNVLMDRTSGRAVGLVDLDTVKPGLIHYDLGDLLRSGGNPLGEETGRWQEVRLDPELARAILGGYLAAAGGFLNRGDYDYLYDAVRIIAFELGLRFFTDFLEGNVYFRAGSREHNLTRALVQFQLTADIEAREPELRALIRDLRRRS